MNDIISQTTIEEGKIDEVPDFYRSISGSPLLEVLDNVKNIKGKIIKLTKVIDTELSIPAADMIFGDGYNSVTLQHQANSLPFISIVVDGELPPISNPDYIISNAFDIDRNYFSIEGYNITGLDVTFKIKAFIYEIV